MPFSRAILLLSFDWLQGDYRHSPQHFTAPFLHPRHPQPLLCNISISVGYSNTASDSAKNPVVGAQFFSVAGGETFKLQDLSIPGEMHWETEEDEGWWEFNTMSPGSEAIRTFNTLAFRQDAAYTYISEAYLVEMTGQDTEPNPDLSDVAWAIGWWKFEASYPYSKAIENHDPDNMKVTADVTFPNGTAFFGNFSTGHDLKIVTSGEVKQQPFAIETNEGKNPLIANQLPVEIDLSDISIPGTMKWETEEDEGWWEFDTMSPGSEALRVFKPNAFTQEAAYTYISEAYLVELTGQDTEPTPDISDVAWAIGWWKFEASYPYSKAIENHDPDHMKVTGSVPVKAGYGFVGNFSTAHSLKINFPGALSVPSKAN